MTDKSPFKISAVAKYPSQNDSFAIKESMDYGRAVGNAIYSDWFYKGSNGSCRFYTSQLDFLERRNYAIGNIDMKKYYPKLGTNGDVSLLNLSKKPLTTVPKLVNLLVNGMCGRKATIGAKAIDPISQQAFQSYRKRIEEDMNSKEIIDLVKQTQGIDIGSMPTEDLPENKDELNIHLQMEWKPSNCLSNELAIASVMEENTYELTVDREVKRDLVELGIACTTNNFHSAKGITIDRIDPLDIVYSNTKDPYFRDCFYKGYVKNTLLSDIYVQYPNLTSEEKEAIANSAEIWRNYQGTTEALNNRTLKGTVNLLFFTFKTTRERAKKMKEKSDGGILISNANEFFDESKKNKKDKYERASIVEEVLFEGCMVLGTQILLKWEVAKSMARPKSNKQKVCDTINIVAPQMYNGKIISCVSLMIPIEDLRNVCELKAEQIIQGITPDGIAVDLDAIAEIDLGDGKANSPQEQFNMYLQKGSFFYRSYGNNGDFNNAQKPFTEIRTGDSINKLTALRNESNYYLTQLTDVIGLNKASDATTPDKDSLVGIQKLAALNSNVATRHILDGAGYLHLKTAEAVSYRISDILKYYPSLREDLIRKIGATAVSDLDSIKDLHLSDFAIFLTLELDDEERAELNKDLSMVVEAGYISLTDKYKVRDIKILDLAIQYLGILIKKGEKKKEEAEANKFKMQSDENIRASQEAEKFKQQTIQMQMDADAIKYKNINEGLIAKEQTQGQESRLTEELKGKNAIELQYVINDGSVKKLETIEKNKKENILEQGNIHSQITDQRAKGKEPINFKANAEVDQIFEMEDEE
jgi:hypothetical protein